MIRLAIRKRLGSFTLEPEFEVGREIAVLFGRSGAGKTLTLEAIAGLVAPDSGHIELNGHAAFDAASGVNLRPYERDVGYLVQNYALFPHLSVRDNIAYGISDLPAVERRRRVAAFVSLLELDGLEERRPAQISGGQSQRVALARALVRRPRVLLLDEPFAALDAAMRTVLRRQLRHLVGDLGLSALLVTHDLSEAYAMADRIAVIDRGRVLQMGPRDAVLNQPVSVRAAELVNVRNILPGRVIQREGEGLAVQTGIGRLIAAEGVAEPGAAVHLAIRAERILLERRDRRSGRQANRLGVRIVNEEAYGPSYTLYLRVDDATQDQPHHLELDIPAHPYGVMGVARHRRWNITVPPEAVHVIVG